MHGPVRFLLVDDTPANLVGLAALLRREGLELSTASSGAEALELLLQHDFDLALLDVQMPDMDGFELAELMRGRERSGHIPIIFVTAGSRDRQRLFKGYEAGAVDFLYKPIDPLILESKVGAFFELAKQRHELADSLRLNEMFVAILGHDLRNPLNTMLMSTSVLEQSNDGAAAHRTLQQMRLAGQRMAGMIDQLLDLTRARLGRGVGIVGTLAPVDVSALVKRATDELQVAHPGRLELRASGDCSSVGDGERLLQVFSNLVANALHHGDAAAAVQVVVEGVGAEGAVVGGVASEIVVSVHNRGTIPPELLATLFEPFRGRVRATRSRGLGLGLFIARQITLAHQGEVSVTSAEGTTTFVVRLPKLAPSQPATRHAPGTGPSQLQLTPPGS